MMIDFKELSFKDSEKLLYKFQIYEKAYSIQWYDVEDSKARYIWLIKDIETPLGFLSYKVYVLPNKIDFLYIVKIYVRKDYSIGNDNLIDGKRASEILFEQINKKNINVLTLESASKGIEKYCEKLGFKYSEEINRELSMVIDSRNRKIMYRLKSEMELSDVEKKFFGDSKTHFSGHL